MSVASATRRGLELVPLMETASGVRALAAYLAAWPPVGSAFPQRALLVTVMGTSPRVPECQEIPSPGLGADFLVSQGLQTQPCSQSATNCLKQTSKSKPNKSSWNPNKQTWVRQGGSQAWRHPGAGPGRCHGDSQPSLPAGSRASALRGEAQRGGWSVPGPELIQVIETHGEGTATPTESSTFSEELGGQPGRRRAQRSWSAQEGGEWPLNQQRGLWKAWKAFPAERICSCVSFLGKT